MDKRSHRGPDNPTDKTPSTPPPDPTDQSPSTPDHNASDSTNRPAAEPKDEPPRDADPTPSDAHPATPAETWKVPDTTERDREPPPDVEKPADLRNRMATNPVFARDGWGQTTDEPVDRQDHPQPTAPSPTIEEERDPAPPAAQNPPDSTADAPAQEPPEDSTRDAQPSTATSDDSTADRTDDSADPSASRTGDASRSTDAADSPGAAAPSDTDRDRSTTTDDPPSADDAAAPPKPITLETEVNGETVGTRLGRWDPARLNLPRPVPADAGNAVPTAEADRSADEENAVAYIAANKETSPWLAPAADCEPAVQSVYASLDQGTGHAHVRHGPALDQLLLAGRVARLEDPAQLDDNLRDRGIDGLDPSKMHLCGRYATAIVDAHAFAAAIAALSEHPDVQNALRSEWDGPKPDRLEVPISDVLGDRGHEYCLGYRLRGDWDEARAERKQWMSAKASGADLSALPEPQAEPIPTFEGGDIFVVFKRNHAASKFEINTVFPNPVES